MRRKLVVVASVALSCLAFSAPASAGLTTSLNDDTLRIFSNTPNEQNSSSFQIDSSDGFIIVDSNIPPVAGYCPVTSDAIVCGSLIDDVKHLSVDLKGGDDAFAMFDPRLLGLPRVRLVTGPGDDQVFSFGSVDASLGPGDDEASLSLVQDKVDGGRGDDLIFGGTGDDLIKGGSGDDKLGGGFAKGESQGFGHSDGSDTFEGGGGKDTILAKDLTRDRKIDCGSGDDKVKRDSFDPKPKSC